MTTGEVTQSAEEQLAEILETRRKNTERQRRHRDKQRELELSDEERAYENSPQRIWDENLETLEANHPAEFAQVQHIQSEYARIKSAMQGVIEAVKLEEEQSHKLLVRKPVVVDDPLPIYEDLKAFERDNSYGSQFRLTLGPTISPAKAPGAEFLSEQYGRDGGLWNYFGIYVVFDSMFVREFLTAAAFHLLTNHIESEAVRQTCEELRNDVVKNFPDRHKAEMLKYYPNNERRFKGTGKLVHSFLTGEPISVSAEPKPKPVIVELPPGIGVRFSVGAQAFQRNQ